MAKRNRNIQDRMDSFLQFKIECLKRTPEYRKDYELWSKTLEASKRPCIPDETMDREELDKCYKKEKKVEKRFYELEKAMLKKYNLHWMSNPYSVNSWKELKASTKACVIVMQLGESLITKGKLAGSEHRLFKIDILRKEDEIIHDLLREIREQQIGIARDKKPEIFNTEFSPLYKRYFAVWDLKKENFSHRKKKWNYSQIVHKLQKEGFYKRQTNNKAEVLARQDYANACKVLGIASKIYRRHTKPIIALPGKKELKGEANIWNKKLEEYGLPAFNEQIIRYKSKGKVKECYKFEGRDNDGVIRKKLKGELRNIN